MDTFNDHFHPFLLFKRSVVEPFPLKPFGVSKD